MISEEANDRPRAGRKKLVRERAHDKRVGVLILVDKQHRVQAAENSLKLRICEQRCEVFRDIVVMERDPRIIDAEKAEIVFDRLVVNSPGGLDCFLTVLLSGDEIAKLLLKR